MYTDTIGLYFKTKLSIYTAKPKQKKHVFFINIKTTGIFKN